MKQCVVNLKAMLLHLTVLWIIVTFMMKLARRAKTALVTASWLCDKHHKHGYCHAVGGQAAPKTGCLVV